MGKPSQIEMKINARISQLQAEISGMQNEYNQKVFELKTLEDILKEKQPEEPVDGKQV